MSPGVTNTAVQHQHQQHRPNFNLTQFWHEEMTKVQSSEPNFKMHPLPLARIKKVMKSDPEVKVKKNHTYVFLLLLVKEN